MQIVGVNVAAQLDVGGERTDGLAKLDHLVAGLQIGQGELAAQGDVGIEREADVVAVDGGTGGQLMRGYANVVVGMNLEDVQVVGHQELIWRP